ncbi:SGNH/GDSL hydrolase family protein [Fulvivirgaceae bacterium BMA12]|uniref:SGNH/GDSL hydrolase family protein n=1 Tax=Agaribacillus aureus TaxID=3051825 RepID=A0ABT8L040_9BACT|nr:SGNH/GDSL hydrolase family protein [Fulvivirgaceae bacterium BMA12]
MIRKIAFVSSLFIGCLACKQQTGNNAKLSNRETSVDMAEPKSGMPLKFLALGDSYTIGESVDTAERWPVVLAERLKEKGLSIEMPEIIATTGWTTDELKQGIEKARPNGSYELVSLLIGVNNQYRGYETAVYEREFQELLDIAISFATKRSRVFVVSIPDYGVTPFGKEKDPEKISQEIDLYNEIKKNLSAKARVQYFDITGISRQAAHDPELVAGDGLHPSGKMYRQWVDIILPGVEKMLE